MKTRLQTYLMTSLAIAAILSSFFFLGFFQTTQAILADSLYTEKGTSKDIIIIAIDDKSLQEIGRWPWDRKNFSMAIDKLKEAKVKLIGIDIAFFEPSNNNSDTALAESINKAGNVVTVVEYTKFSTKDDQIYGTEILRSSFITNANIGFVNLFTDSDGILRSSPARISGIENHMSFSLKIAELILGKKIDINENRFLINFYGKPGAYKYISFSDLVRDRVNIEELRDAIVLIGVTSPDFHDDHAVPISKARRMPGVEVNANAVQTLISGDFLQQQPGWSVTLIILIFAIATATIIYKLKIIFAIPLLFAIVITYVFAAIYAFDNGIILNIIYPILSVVIVFIALVIISYLTEELHKKQIKNAFGRYVSPAVLDEILKNPDLAKLGGVRKKLTIFFSDIRGFTSMSEKMEPEVLVDHLNDYLSTMCDIISKHRGVVDKYIGDAIMAFWGAPVDEPEHARLACETSLEMIMAMKDLQARWKANGLPEIKIGIGLNTGDAIVGNIGAEKRLDYTVIGDTVNSASRFEGLTKQYGVSIVISESVYEEVKDFFIVRELDIVKVVGKDKPVRVFELICRKGDETKELKEKLMEWNKALELYRTRKFKLAKDEFSAIAEKYNDEASRIFAARCEFMRANPPGRDWDGVFELKKK